MAKVSAETSGFMPIKALNQFNADWCIKARILKKAEMRTYKNAKGEGFIQSLDLIDKEGTMIQATAFNDTAKKIAGEVEQNKVYTFAGGQVKIANKKFSSIKNDYCLTLGRETIINEAAEDDETIGTESFQFTSLEKIENIVQQCTVDVVGVVLEAGDVTQLVTKDGNSRDKRALMIGDETNMSIGVTLWGKAAFRPLNIGDIVAFQNCRVSDWQGKSLNASGNPSDITTQSNHTRFRELQAWLNKKGGDLHSMQNDMKALTEVRQKTTGDKPSDVMTIQEMIEAAQDDYDVTSGAKAAYFTVNCFCSWVFVPTDLLERQMYYLACPANKKKMTEESEGRYFCESDGKYYDTADHTYNFSIKISDFTGTVPVSIFGADGQAFTGMTAAEFSKIKDIEEIKAQANTNTMTRNYTLVIRAKVNEFAAQKGDGPEIRYTVVRTKPHNFAAENQELLKRLGIYAEKE